MCWLFVLSVSVFTLASVGCAASDTFPALIACRVLQGFSGGTLIPAVFAAVFLLFPLARQGLATTFAGVLAVLAPTVGPIVGGWITETYSWHWLFLINVAPGIISAIVAGILLPKEPMRLGEARRLDVLSLALLAIGLAALEVALKEAPMRGWTSGLVAGLLALSFASAFSFVRRTLSASRPIVSLATFADRSFAIGCVLSFVLGVGLFGTVYLMPVFLAVVRGHNALEIGAIMLVTGVTQLMTAPIAMIDTVIYTRSPALGTGFMERLQAGDVDTAKFVGIPLDMFMNRPTGPLEGPALTMVQSLVEKAALVQAINEAWITIAVLTIGALLCVPFARSSPRAA
jgi:MFS transporter, DHA2 family, multidrug resistance protein